MLAASPQSERRSTLDGILTIPEYVGVRSSPTDASGEDNAKQEVDVPGSSAVLGPHAELDEYGWFLAGTAGESVSAPAMQEGGYDAALFLTPEVLSALETHAYELGGDVTGVEANGDEANAGVEVTHHATDTAGVVDGTKEVDADLLDSLLRTLSAKDTRDAEVQQTSIEPEHGVDVLSAMLAPVTMRVDRLEAVDNSMLVRLAALEAGMRALQAKLDMLATAAEGTTAPAIREIAVEGVDERDTSGEVKRTAASVQTQVAGLLSDMERTPTPLPCRLDVDEDAPARYQAPPTSVPDTAVCVRDEAPHALDSPTGAQSQTDGTSHPPRVSTAPTEDLACHAIATPMNGPVTPSPTPTPALSSVANADPSQPTPQARLQAGPHATPHRTPAPILRHTTASPRRDHSVKSLPHVLVALSGVPDSRPVTDTAAEGMWHIDLDDFEDEGDATPEGKIEDTSVVCVESLTPPPSPTKSISKGLATVLKNKSQVKDIAVDSDSTEPAAAKSRKNKPSDEARVKPDKKPSTKSSVKNDTNSHSAKTKGNKVKPARPRPPPHAPMARAKGSKRKVEEVRSASPSQARQAKRRRETLAIPQRDEGLLAMSDGRRLGSGTWPAFPRDWNTWRMLKASLVSTWRVTYAQQEIVCDACLGRVHWPCAGLALDGAVPKTRWHCPDCQALIDHEILPAPPGRCIRHDCCRRRKQKIDVRETDAEEYFIKRVVGRCAVGRYEHGGRAFKYLVEWDGYALDECTWEPARNLPKGADGRYPFADDFEAEARAAGVDLKAKVALLPHMHKWFDPVTSQPRGSTTTPPSP